MNIISPKYDFSAKELFSIEMVRKYFISDVLDIPVEQIRSVRLLNTFLWKRYRRQKQGILDVLVELNDDTKINIELQVALSVHWAKRILFYLSKMFTEDLKVGDNYAKLKRCISISILDFNLKENDKYHTVYRLRDDEGNEFSDVFEVHIIELRKKLNGNTKVDDWIRLFNARTEEDLDMIQTKNAGLLEAIREVKTMSLSKRMRLRYEAHLKEIRDRNAREDYVREEGEELKLISQVRKKYKKGKTASEAAEDLEEELSAVQPFYDLIAQYPQENDREILARYKKNIFPDI